MIISELKKEYIENDIKISVVVEMNNKKDELWYKLARKYEKYLSDTYDNFLVAMLYVAMKRGEKLEVKGKISHKLYFNLKNYVVPLLCFYSKTLNEIEIKVDEVVNKRIILKGVGTGFSGGVDSFTTIYDHFVMEKDEDYKINSLLFLNVGSHSMKEEEAKEKFEERFNYLKRYPEEVELPYIKVDSNLFKFYDWEFMESCTLATVSGVLLLQNLYSKYYLSSGGYNYIENMEFYKEDIENDISIFDSILLPLLSTETLELIPDGHKYNRIDKLKRIVKYEPISRYLNVCVSSRAVGYNNCSVCEKCCRTLMTIDSLGELGRFKGIFDIEKYKKIEKKYIKKQVAYSKMNPFSRANIYLARENGRKIPNYYLCILRFLPRIIKGRLKRN